MPKIWKCCCDCNDGGPIDRWLNQTRVRKTEDCDHLSTVNEVAPYSRWIAGGDYVICTAPSLLTKVPPDWMGDWLMGDANGYSSQAISATVDDILACGADDSTHRKLDHNCFEKSGTVNMSSKRRGQRKVFGKKHHHGQLGIIDQSDPSPRVGFDFTGGNLFAGGGFGAWVTEFQTQAPQARYLTIKKTTHVYAEDVPTGGTPIYIGKDYIHTGTCSVSSTSGLRTKTGGITGFDEVAFYPGYPAERIPTPDVWDWLNGDWNGVYDYFRSFLRAVDANANSYVSMTSSGGVATVQLWSGTYPYDGSITAPDYLMEEIKLPLGLGGGFSRIGYVQMSFDSGATFVQKLLFEESATVSNTSMSFLKRNWNAAAYIYGGSGYAEESGEILYSDPYTSGDVLKDFYDQFRQWVLSNSNIHKWELHEKAALAPLTMRDEIQNPVIPQPEALPQADDYSLAQDATDDDGRNPGDPGYVPTWHKRAWFDPSGYIWQAPSGARVDGVAGSTLLGPIRTGQIIAAGIEGGERLFWFNCTNWERVFDSDLGDPAWHWLEISKGAYSDSLLPEATRRWMSPYEAQYDAEAYRGVDVAPPSANYDGSFLREQGGVLTGAKFVMASQDWPAVDFNYPCGDARFDVDQYTVCCVISGDAGSGFRVKKTGNATAIPAVSDKILVEDDGIYPVTGITSHGGDPAEWTITVGSKIEDVPAGRSCLPGNLEATDVYRETAQHLGKLRWWTTSPTSCVTPNPISNKTGVRREYSFNARLAQLPTGSQPNWFDGSGAGTGTGLVGCTGMQMSEFTFTTNKCPAVVGFVPFYSRIPNPASIPNPANIPFGSDAAESFTNQTLFQMPNVFRFDPLFGALWLGLIDLVMPDVFHQDAFKPNCDIDPETERLNWIEDLGDGAADTSEVNEDTGITTYRKFFPHRKWVAARCSIPAGYSLPSGITMLFQTGNNVSPVDQINVIYGAGGGGIKLGTSSGGYRDIEKPWGFAARACVEGNRFGDFYKTFTTCP